MLNYDISESYYELTAKAFKIGNLKISVTPITLMVDSGTTFTHFPTSYVWKILAKLNEFCETNISKCGQLKTPNFEEDSCLELKQPDKNYKNINELLSTFPNISIYF